MSDQGTTKPLKVAIVGCAMSSNRQANDLDESWEIWGLADVWNVVNRWHRWFELHDVGYHVENKPEQYAWLTSQKFGKPIYLLEHRDDVPAGVAYPKAEIMAHFGRYFTNSVSWMIALAIQEGAKQINIYGVDMAQHSEYAHQRPSCEFFCGWAQALGIDIHVPDESDLLKCNKLYGFETHSGEMYRKLRARDQELQERIASADMTERESEERCKLSYGALQEVEALAGVNGNLQEHILQRRADLQNTIKRFSSLRDDSHDKKLLLIGAKESLDWSRQWT